MEEICSITVYCILHKNSRADLNRLTASQKRGVVTNASRPRKEHTRVRRSQRDGWIVNRDSTSVVRPEGLTIANRKSPMAFSLSTTSLAFSWVRPA